VSTQIQYRRGTGVQNDAFTGALGEVTVDTTNKTLRVHDGVAVGGSNIATVAYVSAQLSALSANKINQNASNVTVTASFVNVAVNGTNVAAFSSQSLSLTGFLNVSGNVLGSTASFGGINSTGLINTSGNILSTGLSVFGNTRIGSLATPGALHTIIGNVDVSGAGTEYFNIGGNILAIQGSFGSINSTGFINTSGNVSAAVVNTGALNATGTTTLVAVNSTGFINTSANVSAAIGSFDSITVRAAVTAIANGGTNGVGNIGATGATFNTVFAKATTAQYADLAEVYTSDQQYPGGTVVVFGGQAEVTQSHDSHDTRIAGVVSTEPAYLMNSKETGVPVALQGRVPCRVLGPVSKGDRVVSSHIAGVAQRLDPEHYEPGCIIGKALQAIDSTDISIIEVVVGRV
jgi:hypothetical protein